ncbi:MAG TPA: hypothetical protein VG891_12630 [Rhizomicrobium sp.]|nr:hypothetical protein [Rhizomicrobium sp.]
MRKKLTEEERAAIRARRPHPRRLIVRDVAILQLKLFIGNVHNFLLMPVALLAAALDILFKNRRDEAWLYKTLAWARHFEERIGLYSALREDAHHPPEKYSIDAVIARVETAIKKNYESGGTAASMKAAADKAFERMASRTAKLRKPNLQQETNSEVE